MFIWNIFDFISSTMDLLHYEELGCPCVSIYVGSNKKDSRRPIET